LTSLRYCWEGEFIDKTEIEEERRRRRRSVLR
jgi:hypothetical protein